MIQRLLSILTIFLAGTCCVAQTTTPAHSATTGQGSVVWWPGNCKRCSLADRAWDPVNGTCYYAIDMEKKPGTYTLSRRTTGGKLESAQLVVMEKPCHVENIKNFKKTNTSTCRPPTWPGTARDGRAESGSAGKERGATCGVRSARR